MLKKRSIETQHKCRIDEVENKTSDASQNLHMNDFKYQWPVNSYKALGGMAKMPTDKSAMASEAKNMLFVILR